MSGNAATISYIAANVLAIVAFVVSKFSPRIGRYLEKLLGVAIVVGALLVIGLAIWRFRDSGTIVHLHRYGSSTTTDSSTPLFVRVIAGSIAAAGCAFALYIGVAILRDKRRRPDDEPK